MKLKFKKLTQTAKTPIRTNRSDSGLDLFSDEDIIIPGCNLTFKIENVYYDQLSYLSLYTEASDVELQDTYLQDMFPVDLSDWEVKGISKIDFEYHNKEFESVDNLTSVSFPNDVYFTYTTSEQVTNIHRAKISTGIAISLPEEYEAQIRPKSGISNSGILCQFGTIDQSYRGDLQVILVNLTTNDYLIRKGQKIAQLVIVPVITPELEEVSKLDSTDRGSNGFGSSGLF
jgi:dUTP pyrophosphatase